MSSLISRHRKRFGVAARKSASRAPGGKKACPSYALQWIYSGQLSNLDLQQSTQCQAPALPPGKGSVAQNMPVMK
jgi:hypothetical protein